ncbi:hypothetical protein L915_17981 [Phytophthora nicotianae]|uniref:Tyr recombinase domain-containing protein n=1 Tax=Phytophthora nicotianae TaxID=4792 RepID=W2FX56_PHYNI|nr:hypothetical protein L915_17981 [Phytophthora nicotianae]
MRPRLGANYRSPTMALSPAWPSLAGLRHQGSSPFSGRRFDIINAQGHPSCWVIEPFWIFQWVDDIVLVEVDIGDRLQKAEKRLRDGVKLVFGSDGWHEGKFTTWSRVFHAVGTDWNIPGESIAVPQRKIEKMHRVVSKTKAKKFLSRKQLDSGEGAEAYYQLHLGHKAVYTKFEAKAQQLKQAAVADGTLGRYRKNFKFWESFCKEVGQPVWIDKLHRAEQARIVGLFAGLCASEGHNRSKVGNKFQTFDGKMAAVQFAHKAVRNAKPDYHDPEFELIAQGYKRSNSQVNLKQPVIAQMLLKMREVLGTPDKRGELMCGSIILPFFFLDRSSELWGPVTIDRSTGQERVHCIKVSNVKLLGKHGDPVDPEATNATSVEIRAAAQGCLRVSAKWVNEGVKLGPYITSVSPGETTKKLRVSQLIKGTTPYLGLNPKDYSSHSLRIGDACALLAAGKSDLVIRLMGRWSSWCFTVYTRLKPGMIRDVASSMIKASTWEFHEPNSIQLEGDSSEPTSLS